ncbi:hypothetical protein A2Z00_05670 [Candidatus Gottesmanbacteria bacterium RBG_13_45_10]|uniref:ArnT-like N-terminal domain-containing protein n=1 Tax=Candidatus Gottesmanbacteria bacterium RBG_13_45_10 TaxID=1798370 RepID=A0A1F5ZG73_9BACT|nr:MAG: hypothetical protein A2Z00_05670 [Candidatus Gottesmanbacteria bacterium RBG_13_45_10]
MEKQLSFHDRIEATHGTRERQDPTTIIKSSHHLCAGILLALCFSIIMIATYKDYGITWDEPVYVRKATLYMEWITRPSLSTIDFHWNIWDMHPPLTKILGGITSYIFSTKLQLANIDTTYRMGTVALVFLVTYVMYLYMVRRYGTFVALFTTTSFFFLPRVFYEAHIGGLDYTVTALSVLTIMSFIEGYRDRRWFWASAIFLGLAHLTKIQGFFLYVPIVITWFASCMLALAKWRQTHQVPKIYLKKLFLENIVPMTFIPPLVFWAGWPRMWTHPVARFIEYLMLEFGKYRVEVYYLGQTYKELAPWHYPIVLTLATVPVVILALFFIGVVSMFRKAKPFESLLLLSCIIPIAVIAAPGVSKYDGVRLFLPAFPFLCLIAGIGVSAILSFAKKRHITKPVTLFLTVTLALTILTGTVLTHPYQSSYFNELVGGVDGAEHLGFETEYWGNAYIGVLPWMNQHKASNLCIWPMTEAFDMYKQIGLLDRDVTYTLPNGSCNYLILLSRQGFFFVDPLYWDLYRNATPVYSVILSHTRLVSVYKL